MTLKKNIFQYEIDWPNWILNCICCLVPWFSRHTSFSAYVVCEHITIQWLDKRAHTQSSAPFPPVWPRWVQWPREETWWKQTAGRGEREGFSPAPNPCNNTGKSLSVVTFYSQNKAIHHLKNMKTQSCSMTWYKFKTMIHFISSYVQQLIFQRWKNIKAMKTNYSLIQKYTHQTTFMENAEIKMKS